MDNFPKYIVATREVYYDVRRTIEAMQETAEEGHVVTYDELFAQVQDWADIDLGCEWGHELSGTPVQFREED